jgi:hypothetical protein
MQGQILVPHSQMPRSRGTRSKHLVVSRAEAVWFLKAEQQQRRRPLPLPGSGCLVSGGANRAYLEAGVRLPACVRWERLGRHLQSLSARAPPPRCLLSPLRPPFSAPPRRTHGRAAQGCISSCSKCRGSMGQGAGPTVLSFLRLSL